MGSRNQEFVAFVVDVGPHMHSLLPHIGDFLMCSVEAKLLNKPSHEVAVLLYGTTETNNEPNLEAVATGTDSAFMHITVQHNYRLPNLETLRACRDLPLGTGASDILDALLVATDMITKCAKRRLLGKVAKRFVLVSNFRARGAGWDAEFKDAVVNKCRELAVKLDVIHVDFDPSRPDQDFTPAGHGTQGTTQAATQVPGSLSGGSQEQGMFSAEATAAMEENMEWITGMLQDLGCNEPKHIKSAAELAMALKWVEVGAVSTFKGDFKLGDTVSLPVRTYKKVARETLPSLKDFVPAPVAAAAANFTHEVERSREYRLVDDPEAPPVPEDQVINGYPYGGQAVPVDPHVEPDMKYGIKERCMHLIGFVPAAQVARCAYMSESLVVVPEVTSPAAGPAVSALVRAMHRDGQVALARLVARSGSRPLVMVLTPWLGTMRRPDAWIANQLPFEQDCKWIHFPPILKGDTPSDDQLSAARDLVDAMQLKDGREMLAPEGTPNPSLRRFYLAAAVKALDPDSAAAPVPAVEDDPLLRAVFNPPAKVASSVAAQAAKKRMSEVFPTRVVSQKGTADAAPGRHAFDDGDEIRQEQAAAGEGQAGPSTAATAAEGGDINSDTAAVGTATPLDDFAALVARPGKLEDALLGLRGVILQLVDNSVGSRQYDKAAACLAALREACVQNQSPKQFNEHLQGLVARYKHHEAHPAFFQRLISAGITLISTDEVAQECEGVVSSEQAQEFLAVHSATTEAAPPVVVPVDEDDEFADMD